ncbi:MAG: hypothetical protein JWL59_4227 [Chthoniobacteraceae bacterium]|nr:hypothetical protein [Chthoniobacteraceae bacterium]
MKVKNKNSGVCFGIGCTMRALLACLILMAFFGTAYAGWEFREHEESRIAFTKVKGTDSSGKAMTATLLLNYSKEHRSKARGKTLTSIDLCVHHPSAKAFNFEDFNGPDAAASSKKLLRIEIVSGKQKVTERFSPSGWENQLEWMLDGAPAPDKKTKSEALDFTFGLEDPVGSRESFRRIAAGLRNGAKMTILIQENAVPGRTLQFDVPQEGTAQAIEKLLR